MIHEITRTYANKELTITEFHTDRYLTSER